MMARSLGRWPSGQLAGIGAAAGGHETARFIVTRSAVPHFPVMSAMRGRIQRISATPSNLSR
jgi:hypothetical protein